MILAKNTLLRVRRDNSRHFSHKTAIRGILKNKKSLWTSFKRLKSLFGNPAASLVWLRRGRLRAPLCGDILGVKSRGSYRCRVHRGKRQKIGRCRRWQNRHSIQGGWSLSNIRSIWISESWTFCVAPQGPGWGLSMPPSSPIRRPASSFTSHEIQGWLLIASRTNLICSASDGI